MPITKITGAGVKGRTFEQELSKRTLFVGPNGCGKTSRSIALQLAVLGYVPGAGKQQGGTFDAFAPQDATELWAGIEVDGKLIERGFTRSKSGTTSKAFKVKRMKAKANEFDAALHKADIAVMDLSDFVSASDAKKIDWLFHLYSDVDVAEIEQRLEKQAKTVKDLDRRVKDATGTVAQLQAAKSNLELPAGTLAEKQAEIVEREKQLAKAQDELKAAQIAEAEERAREQERQRAAEEARKSSTAQVPAAESPRPERTTSAPPRRESSTQQNQAQAQQPNLFSEPTPPRADVAPAECADPTLPLQRVLATLESAGCQACAARLVTLKELNRLKQEEVAHA